jgi:hypothetical protein
LAFNACLSFSNSLRTSSAKWAVSACSCDEADSTCGRTGDGSPLTSEGDVGGGVASVVETLTVGGGIWSDVEAVEVLSTNAF